MHQSVGAIIRNKEGKILLLDRTKVPFGWACPAGHVDGSKESKSVEDETPEVALIREVKEETNLAVKKYHLILHEFIGWGRCSRGVCGHDYFVFEVDEWEGEVKKADREAKDIGWFSREEIKSLKLEPVWEYFFGKMGFLKSE